MPRARLRRDVLAHDFTRRIPRITIRVIAPFKPRLSAAGFQKSAVSRPANTASRSWVSRRHSSHFRSSGSQGSRRTRALFFWTPTGLSIARPFLALCQCSSSVFGSMSLICTGAAALKRTDSPACTSAKGPIPESPEVPGSNWI